MYMLCVCVCVCVCVCLSVFRTSPLYCAGLFVGNGAILVARHLRHVAVCGGVVTAFQDQHHCHALDAVAERRHEVDKDQLHPQRHGLRDL